MREPEKPKRRFWQIHLSTVLLLALTFGAAVGMNMTNFLCLWRPLVIYNNFDRSNSETERILRSENGERIYGWPYAALSTFSQPYNYEKPSSLDGVDTYRLHREGIAVNVMLWSIFVVALSVIAENFARRREGRKI